MASRLVVHGATGVATEMGLAEGFVGFSVVAIGTSLPELVTGIQAARRDEMDLVAGNVLGSNLFNSLAIAGLVGVVAPVSGFALASVALMAAFVVLTWVFLATHHRLTRRESLILLGVYLLSLPLLGALSA